MRLPLITACALLALAVLATSAWAEEVFVLEGGTVLRGRAVREIDDKIVIRLSGLGEENTITVYEHEIKRRFVSAVVDNGGSGDPVEPNPNDPLPDGPPPVPAPNLVSPSGGNARNTAPTVFDTPAAVGAPDLANEGFFERLKRVTGLALPKSFEGLLLIAFLLFVVLTVLVAGGTHALGMKAPALHASTSLGLLLGVFLAADFLLHTEILRADRAIWVIPLQAAIWLIVARSALDAPLSKTVPLFAIVLFGSTCFMFFTGSLLVSV